MALGAAAVVTSRIRIGLLVTPLARRRPWVVARQSATLDLLSGGRLVFGAGLGTPADAEFETFGETGDDRTRAEMLDESLAILAGLWSGEPFAHQGRHFGIDEVTFLPTPAQRPRIPVWVAGRWPNRAPIRRAVRWDGYFPIRTGGFLEPGEVAAISAACNEQRAAGAAPFDIIIEGVTAGPDDTEQVRGCGDAGATWWLEHLSWKRGPLDAMRTRLAAGPPRLGAADAQD